MKKTIILTAILFSFIQFNYAQDAPKKNKAYGNFYFKGGAGKLTPLSSSSPAVVKSNDYSSSFAFGIMGGGFTKNKFAFGLEFSGFQSKLVNNDLSLGINGDYKLNGSLFKFVFQYSITDWLNLQYNIGWGSIMSSRPWFTVPANVSYNGKILEEYPIEKLNNCFVTGFGINIKTVKWMSINFNCDYIGATFNYNYVVHSEDKMVTKVYDTDFKLRSYMLSAGIIIHTPFE